MTQRGGPSSEAERRNTPKADTLDFHRSPVEAVHCFLATEFAVLRRYDWIYEPACGDGSLVVPLRNAGHNVIASDIVDRGCPQSHVQDFLDPGFVPHLAQRRRIAAFTNPPFNRAEEFIFKACANFDYVAMILRLRFLAAKHLVEPETGRSVRNGNGVPLWRVTRLPFARVIMPKSRWPIMSRGDYEGEEATSMIDFAIFVWEAGHRGPPQIINEPDSRFMPAIITEPSTNKETAP